jgi:hypothetical protein
MALSKPRRLTWTQCLMTMYIRHQTRNLSSSQSNLIPQRIPGAVQIGAINTYGDVMSGKATWKLQHTMASLSRSTLIRPRNYLLQESPTVGELYARLEEEMRKTGPTERGIPHNGTPALAIRLPNNGFPEGTCAGCGADSGKGGGGLQQCGRCKGRKYCRQKCQKLDWARHNSDCAQVRLRSLRG